MELGFFLKLNRDIHSIPGLVNVSRSAFRKSLVTFIKVEKFLGIFVAIAYSRGKKDTDPYNISPIEMRSF